MTEDLRNVTGVVTLDLNSSSVLYLEAEKKTLFFYFFVSFLYVYGYSPVFNLVLVSTYQSLYLYLVLYFHTTENESK